VEEWGRNRPEDGSLDVNDAKFWTNVIEEIVFKSKAAESYGKHPLDVLPLAHVFRGVASENTTAKPNLLFQLVG
jgi:hypothetical protein